MRGIDVPVPRGGDFWTAIIDAIDQTVASGGRIRFNLDGVDIEAAFDPSNTELYNSYTSRELRYALKAHPRGVDYYLGGYRVSPPGCRDEKWIRRITI
jgi:phosphatidylserine/phosphatidylglycerophosphate/cardiolipin synthase-like enzyme